MTNNRALADLAGDATLLDAASTGKQTIPFAAGGMTPTTTNGAAPGSTELVTNDIMVESMDFDAATKEYVQFRFPCVASMDVSAGFTAKFRWSHAAATTYDVIWGVQMLALSDGDAQDAAFGTAIEVTDSGGTTDDEYIAPETAGITPSGSLAEGDTVVVQVYRKAADGSDTLDVDARLEMVEIFYTLDKLTDA
jgi:hypothetical protein